MWSTGFIKVTKPLNIRSKPNLNSKSVGFVEPTESGKLYQWQEIEDKSWLKIAVHEFDKPIIEGYIIKRYANLLPINIYQTQDEELWLDLPYNSTKTNVSLSKQEKDKFAKLLTMLIEILHTIPEERYATNMTLGEITKYLVRIAELRRKLVISEEIDEKHD